MQQAGNATSILAVGIDPSYTGLTTLPRVKRTLRVAYHHYRPVHGQATLPTYTYCRDPLLEMCGVIMMTMKPLFLLFFSIRVQDSHVSISY